MNRFAVLLFLFALCQIQCRRPKSQNLLQGNTLDPNALQQQINAYQQFLPPGFANEVEKTIQSGQVKLPLSKVGALQQIFQNGQINIQDVATKAEDEPLPEQATIRIQLPAAEGSLLCVAVESSPIPHLGSRPCSYASNQFFTFDRKTSTLYSEDDDGNYQYWVPAIKPPKELANQLAGKVAIIGSDEPGEWTWGVNLRENNRIRINRKSTGGRICLQASEEGKQALLYGVRLSEELRDYSSCGFFTTLFPSDESVEIAITRLHKIPDASGVFQDVKDCVAYDADHGNQSALYMTQCDFRRPEQRFQYNLITTHLSTLNGTGLFFWWRGPIKSYPDLEPTDAGYGWNFNVRRSGSVVANDKRGYSGVCWTVINNRISVEQICDVFSMMPLKSSLMFKSIESAARNFYSVVVTQPAASPNGKPKCLTIFRNPQYEEKSSFKGRPLWGLEFRPCDFSTYRVDQRFVLSVDPYGSPECFANSTYCEGQLRWSGDVRNVVILPRRFMAYHLHSDTPMVGASASDTDVPYLFTFPLNKKSPVTVKSRGRKGCYKVMDGQLALGPTGSGTACLQLQVLFTSSVPPESLDVGVATIERYDSRSVVALPTAGNTDTSDLQTARKSLAARSINHKLRMKLMRLFDFFYADLGRSGSRRFRAIGNLDTRPNGALVANSKPGSGSGILLPLERDDFGPYNWILIDVYFRALQDLIQNKSYVLWSFARGSGCVVYVTYTGMPGLKCYTGAGNGEASLATSTY
eukprot:TRINITY_DN1237_c0_g1_i15.p1 TRINITY_DN1237_c0_g1~~TRINITY_DN1237_c0_g1_i15.p1  ORF type:complete len:750 (+),score=134.34 TRINITY_DN1237_c0_g1_i15:66-2315(+)